VKTHISIFSVTSLYFHFT